MLHSHLSDFVRFGPPFRPYFPVSPPSPLVPLWSTPPSFASLPTLPSVSTSMQLTFVTASGLTHPVVIQTSNTVHDLKRAFHSIRSFSPDQFILIHQGHHLSDDHALVVDYGVTSESRINVAIRVRGGARVNHTMPRTEDDPYPYPTWQSVQWQMPRHAPAA